MSVKPHVLSDAFRRWAQAPLVLKHAARGRAGGPPVVSCQSPSRAGSSRTSSAASRTRSSWSGVAVAQIRICRPRAGDLVDIQAVWTDGRARSVRGFRVVEYATPPGTAALDSV